jgi:hypothetical protein
MKGWPKGKKNPEQSKRMKKNNPMEYSDIREKHRKAMNRPEVCKAIGDAQLGRKRPDISEIMKRKTGENHPLFGKPSCNKGKHINCGENHPMFGKKRPDVSERNRERSGENHPNWWLGGKSFEPYGVAFNNVLKEQIRERDNYQCQECGYFQKDLGYKLPVHHIDYDKKNNVPLNLISLCKSCHSKTGYDRDNWIGHYQQKVFGVAECYLK